MRVSGLQQVSVGDGVCSLLERTVIHLPPQRHSVDSSARLESPTERYFDFVTLYPPIAQKGYHGTGQKSDLLGNNPGFLLWSRSDDPQDSVVPEPRHVHNSFLVVLAFQQDTATVSPRMDGAWLEMMVDNEPMHSIETFGPSSPSATLRQRGGCKSAALPGMIDVFDTSSFISDVESISVAKDPEFASFALPAASAAPLTVRPNELLATNSDSCVPAGFEWVKEMEPPARAKRSRKADSTIKQNLSSATSARKRSTNLSSSSLRWAPLHTIGNDHVALEPSGNSTDSSTKTQHLPANPPGTSASTSTSASQSLPLKAPSSLPVNGTIGWPKNANLLGDDALQTEITTSSVETFDMLLHTATFGAHAPAAGVSSIKKNRHNLTERKRIDRLNQLFNRLNATIDGDESLLDGSVEDGSDFKPKKDRSKAEVLEDALETIVDLRKQLSELRMEQTHFDLSVRDLENICCTMSDRDETTSTSEGDDHSDIASK